jgi:flagellar hook-length control protein FliK
MRDLPINISNSPASVAVLAGKNSAIKQGDSQEFGHVLARQINDPVKSGEQDASHTNTPASEGKSKTEESKDDSGKNNIQATVPTDNATSEPTNIIPADILATLLTPANQQAVAAIVLSQPDAKEQTDLSGKALPISPKSLTKFGMLGSAAKADRASTDVQIGADSAKQGALSGQFMTGLAKALTLAEKNFTDNNNPLLHAGKSVELNTIAMHSAIAPAVSNTSSPTSTTNINTPFTQTAWADEFSQKVTWIASQHMQSAELHLNPPQLGPLNVVLKLHGDQATATFTSPHAAVREAIEQAMPKLREMLADSGITLGNAMVADQPAYKQQDGSSQQAKNKAKTADSNTEVSAVAEAKIATISRQQGMVDTFA